eukprot:TRINITY_DN6820_c0_g1_i6.p1 TRINITY_DN6820_c0_g1~~TRINITY_DN6820_c0_g1_i6.p1  ORF type:complete len:7637 (+),score=112.47 TRINITY_DN6820_c0_g1_i6:5459-28369(+)
MCNTQPCAIDCQLSAWSGWPLCARDCGSVLVRPAYGGINRSGVLVEARTCNTQPCAVDCKVSEWSSWSPCSKPCDGGASQRTRAVVQAPLYGGTGCPSLEETQHCNTQPCPIDCAVSTWSSWSDCTKSCGTGERKRSRYVLHEAQHGGTACPQLIDYESCNVQLCPVDCQVSDWGPWNTCTKVCGTGTKSRARTVIVAPLYGGLGCPSLSETVDCNVLPCPIDCDVSPWGEWHPCTLKCGGGSTARTRMIIQEPLNGGKPCPELVENSICNTQKCPDTQCQVSPWTDWSLCTVSCGGGTHNRSRSIIVAPTGNATCPELTHVEPCNTTPCPIDCVVTSWGSWDTCSKDCGTGEQKRTRTIQIQAAFGGLACPDLLVDVRPCNTQECPVNCVLGQWGEWSACSVACGTGTTTRQRLVITQPAYGGLACGAITETLHCNEQPCAVACTVSPWGEWSPCSKSCGRGERFRKRSEVQAAQHGGTACPALIEYQDCNDDPCPVDCVVSDWQLWSDCSAVCDGGTRVRTRTVLIPPAAGGSACPLLSQQEACNIHPCPVPCEVSNWGVWESCSVECGNGTQIRRRSVVTQPRYGGDVCPALIETQACNTAPCPPTPCNVTAWSEWSLCTKTCGGGTHRRTRAIIVQPTGPETCPELEETQACNTHACPVNCVVGEWGSWTTCSLACGGGTQVRVRAVQVPAAFGGAECPDDLREVRICNSQPCPVNCIMSSWTEWTNCSASCGGGTQTRTMAVVQPALNGGIECPSEEARTETLHCNVQPCPVDCRVSSWSSWGECSKTCGGGEQQRSRSVLQQATHGGVSCPHLSEYQECNAQLCPIDCLVGQWTPWSDCTLKCGGGITTRSRPVQVAASNGGLQCPVTEEKQSCNSDACATDCSVSSWGAWSPCSLSCGGGTQYHTRTIIQGPANGGAACPTLSESQPCNVDPCPDTLCEVSSWSEFSPCSVSCGGGFKTRTRVITVQPTGKESCPQLSDRQLCNEQPCPIDCLLSEFTPWSPCSLDCGTGSQTRVRQVLLQSAYGGAPCPAESSLTEQQQCNKQPCPVNCEVGNWTSWSVCSVACGVGTTTRTRGIVVFPSNGGDSCPALTETQHCNDFPCPVDCQVGSWNEWSTCSATCGGGTTLRQRQIIIAAAFGGASCPALNESDVCNPLPCPINCVVSSWSDWTTCSSPCNSGEQTRTRSIMVNAAYGGLACPLLTERRTCNEFACPPTPCEVGDWGVWSNCTAACNGGTMTRSRVVTKPPTGGEPCPVLSEARTCNEHPCPVDCVVIGWSDWGTCSADCGGGTRSMTRSVSTQPAYGGAPCPTDLIRTEACNGQACPINCVVSDWTTWSSCSKICDGGVKTRTRHVITNPQFNGTICPTDLTESLVCNDYPCPCLVSLWSEWSPCSKTCGGGERRRTRTVTDPGTGGSACPLLEEFEQCSTDACPGGSTDNPGTTIDCLVSDWSGFTDCTKTCGGGDRQRTRYVIRPPANGGSACPDLIQRDSCNDQACPVDCVLGPWGDFSNCSVICGGGSRVRTRTVLISPSNGGSTCGLLEEFVDCNVQPCKVDCVVSAWAEWGTCSLSCGGGMQNRERFVTTDPLHGGSPCPALAETRSCNTQACPPVDCQLSDWSAWSLCSKSCGGGSKTRTRTVTVAPTGNNTCSTLTETQTCNTEPCPIDCVMGLWGEWQACTKLCGGGVESRIRLPETLPAFGGLPCPANNTESRPCNAQPCAIDCQVSEWRTWTPCSTPCGPGSQNRTRIVVIVPQFGGIDCPGLVETRECNLQPCSVDCLVSDWEAWSPCSVNCGGGERVRIRSVTQAPANGGGACPALQEFAPCNTQLCATDCKLSEWSEWTPCNRACGGGLRSRTRSVVVPSSNGGLPCPSTSDLRQEEDCNLNPCPIDCVTSSWSAWSPCSVACGTGQQSRSRAVTTQAQFNGQTCPPLSETQPCNTQDCPPTACVVSSWSDWSPCTKPCGSGKTTRTRSIDVAPTGNQVCPALTETRTCNDQACPVDCVVSEWSNWDTCSKDCGGGLQKRTRNILVGTSNGGALCPVDLSESQPCNTNACPHDCTLSEWSDWSVCDQACGGGIQRRSRKIATPAANGGKECSGALEDTMHCNVQPCPIDCVVSGWSEWSTCTATCGGGDRQRTRSVLVATSNGGKACPTLLEVSACNPTPCPIDCVVSSWTEWDTCSASCGGGYRKRSRTIVTSSQNGGHVCPVLEEQEACNKVACPVDCVVSAWGSWDRCSADCGGGQTQRVRTITTAPANGGAPCPALVEHIACNQQVCRVECEVSSWSEWSVCSLPCGGGLKNRTRSVTLAPVNASCPALSETAACNEQSCAIDCVPGNWQDWSACSVQCGGGSQSRRREIVIQAAFGGRPCSQADLEQFRECNTAPCVQDCQVSDWSPYGACDKTCGTGSQIRTRHVIVAPSNGGAACPTLEDRLTCNTNPCPVDCVLSNWEPWSTCTKPCGTGQMIRKRSVLIPASNGGVGCSALEEVSSCNVGYCQVDCVVGPWQDWTPCSKDCGVGTRTRTRVVRQAAEFGGLACPQLVEEEYCNTHDCPVNCQVSDWSSWSPCSVACGGGERTHTRNITVQPAFGGAVCPVLTAHEACNVVKCPDTACEVSVWSQWSPCSVSCGGGFYNRTRTILVAPTGAEQCPTLFEQRSCNELPCPVDCVVSPWSDWDTCTKDCNGGTQQRTRQILVRASSGGVACPNSLVETQGCNMDPCAVDCEVTLWSDWSACTASCGSGTQTRTRSVVTQPSKGGKLCPDITETQACNTQACPVDCVVSSWGSWTDCSKSCGGGERRHSRTVVEAPANGGKECPALEEVQPCNDFACPVDCVVSSWSAWSACSATCGGGQRTRTRYVVTSAKDNGIPCPALLEQEPCNIDIPCPEDCQVSEWSQWGICSATCGGGEHSRTRTVIKAAKFGGVACPKLTETEQCNTDLCPDTSCVVSEWSLWGPCTATCGGGIHNRTRSIVTWPTGNQTCAALTEERVCNVHSCPVDCIMGEWGEFDSCSQVCGGGTQKRTRTALQMAAYGGRSCPDDWVEARPCNEQPCPVDCTVSAWGPWTECSKPCGGGMQGRSRSILTAPKNGGAACPTLIDTISCNNDPCPVDCVVGDWSEWEACSRSCGGGQRTRQRLVLQAPSSGGNSCPSLTELVVCNEEPCPVDCVVSSWSDWSKCSQSCGSGIRTRTRRAVVSSANGGSACPPLEESEPCNVFACPVDCVVSSWGAWSPCSVSCGGGERTQERIVITLPQNGGVPCPVLLQREACNVAPCPPVSCVVGSWSEWTLCSVNCGGGQRSRSRSILVQPSGGDACPPLNETRACNEAPCPVDCIVTDWGAWDTCSATCGGGTQRRVRTITQQATNGGIPCPTSLVDTRNCNEFACPVDCVVGDWSVWSACSALCGGGRSERTRIITKPPSNGGKMCDGLVESRQCNTDPCAVDCVVSDWSQWGACSQPCGGGETKRSRTILTMNSHGGQPCPVLNEYQPCSTQPCPVDCVVSDWGSWSQCNKPCGGGTQLRGRQILTNAAYGGVSCPPLLESTACNTFNCPQDCEVSVWSEWSSCTLPCGGGEMTRTRNITSSPQNGGLPCPVLVDHLGCNQQTCPLTECQVSPWSDWSACSAPCGGGTHQRHRSIVVQPATGAAACPPLVESRLCHEDPCPVNCVMSDWSTWSVCSLSCGGGIQTRKRSVKVAAAYGGLPCPADLHEDQPCNTNPCPVNCVVSEWTPWNECSLRCGGGLTTRSRSIIVAPLNGGKDCPLMLETQHCNTQACPVDCVVSAWSLWSECSTSCGGGERTRKRQIVTQPANGGTSCPITEQYESCNESPCPIDCVVEKWSAWSDCDEQCGSGERVRRRAVKVREMYGGEPCPALEERETCNTQPCPIHCEVSAWGTWESCSVTCGGGLQARRRLVTIPAAYGGMPCPILVETQQCNLAPCPDTTCVVSPWSTWSPCSSSCDGGTTSRTRQVVTSPTGLQTCPALREERTCNETPCPVDCVLSSWSDWTSCSLPCGKGTQTRSRTILVRSANSGSPCPTTLNETRSCNSQACPVDCVVGDWSDWSACPVPCGGGLIQRTRVVLLPAANGGRPCDNEALIEIKHCNEHACAVDCVMSSWSEFGQCSQPCGGGFKLRSRTILTKPANGGVACNATAEYAPCNLQPCAVNCVVSEWTEWSLCSVDCGGGRRTRSRTITTPPSGNGSSACPPLSEIQDCNPEPCSSDCVVSEWGSWSNCSVSCGLGTQARSRSVATQPLHGGRVCPSLFESRECDMGICAPSCTVGNWTDWDTCSKRCGGGTTSRRRIVIAALDVSACPLLEETVPCNTVPCPVDCQVSDWSDWDRCTKDCGAGTQKRRRIIEVQPAYNGTGCPIEMEQSRICNENPCDVDCLVSTWDSWTPCSSACGRGSKSRKRSILTAPVGNGARCPELVETMPCNMDPCPVDCVVDPWEAWSDCNKDCGGGTKSRNRFIRTHTANGGLPCPDLKETVDCNTQPCPVDCVTSSWAAWSPCSVVCGGGQQQRSRTVLQQPQYGGRSCPSLTEVIPCNTQRCPDTTCVVGQWTDWSTCTAACGGGSQLRTRPVDIQPNGTDVCPDLQERRTCNEQPCPIDCVVTSWSTWEPCSKECGGGSQRRTRSISVAANYGGKPCPSDLQDAQPCNTQPCPVNCEVAEWGIWSSCSLSCGSGVRNRTRKVITASANGGAACPAVVETEVCNTFACPIACVVSTWSTWSTCSKTCGVGEQKRSRTVTTQPEFGGASCPQLEEYQPCALPPCPVDCQLSTWSSWTPCNQTCGGGFQIRSRALVVAPSNGGVPCGPLTESLSCNTELCPVDCKVSDWSTWGPCSVSCGGGEHTSQRNVIAPPVAGGAPCPALLRTEPCNTQACPATTCVVSAWSPWTPCTQPCGSGKHTRTRTVLSKPSGADTCPELTQEEPCNETPCPVDCVLSEWSTWGMCSAECNGGTQKRVRTVTTQAAFNGTACSVHLVEQRPCNEHPCPINCVLSDWSGWSDCSQACGGGLQTNVRFVITPAANGGKQCPEDVVQQRHCNQQACPVNCQVSEWGEWGECDKACGGGQKTKTRKVIQEAANGGTECPELVVTTACNEQPCPVDCVVAQWGSWTECTKTCGGGVRSRTRKVVLAAQHSGLPCPALAEEEICNTDPCPINCVVFGWQPWSPCSAACGTGQQSRVRFVDTMPSHGGEPCPELLDVRDCNTQPCPITGCQVSAWGSFSACSVTCNGGSMTRTRTVTAPGPDCPPLSEARVCNTTPCPIDCQVTAWSEWSTCTKSCGSGIQTRTRTVNWQASNGGAPCPDLSEAQSCNIQPCPTDCQMTAWSDWSDCSVPCGSGTQSRFRLVAEQSTNGGQPCGPPVETRVCNANPCPVDCIVGQWTEWGKCSSSCAGGLRKRSRVIVVLPSNGGEECPSLEDWEICNPQPCPVDCQLSVWGLWSVCTKKCGTGTRSRSRTVIAYPANGGRSCDALEEHEDCNTDPCPVSCVVSQWGTWQSCTLPCGGGEQSRYRTVISKAQNGGQECPVLVETQACNTAPCSKTTCQVTEWGDWASCTKTCGGGATYRNRTILSPGADCPPLSETRMCATDPCPVDCVVSEWSEWDSCTAPCGGGSQARHRAVDVATAFGGTACPSDLVQTRSCNTQPCPVDCVMGEWTQWSPCSATCGGGTKARSRVIRRLPTNNGQPCPTTLEEIVLCNPQSCEIDCGVSEWGEWSPCSKSCGGGEIKRSRVITIHPTPGGLVCPALTDIKACNEQLCPQDCALSGWSSWSACSASCGGGYRKRTRSVITGPVNGGAACGTLEDFEDCNLNACPVDCQLSAWSEWGACSMSCGPGFQYRHRVITSAPLHGGLACGNLSDVRPCNLQPCPVGGCVVSDWSNFTACSATCGGGFTSRSRRVLTDITNGAQCPPLYETQECNSQPCNVDCVISPWSEWQPCSVECGIGFQNRTRQIETLPVGSGKACPLGLVETRTCNELPCPVACVMSGWSNWTECSSSCGTGVMNRTRAVITAAANGGAPCGVSLELRHCNTLPCPVDCVVSSWSDWGPCSVSCGAGEMIRTRQVSRQPAFGGAVCPQLMESQPCNTQPCPVDCTVSAWSAWSECSVACGGGQQSRNRFVVQPDSFGGAACPILTQTQDCNAQHCPIDCVVGNWKDWEPCSLPCGSGSQTRHRPVITPALYGGKPCLDLIETKVCNAQPCQTTCEMGTWSSWSSCSKICGGGTQTRTRSIIRSAQDCLPTQETQACNTQACPVDCVVSEWSEPTACSKPCDGGTQTRVRQVLQQGANGGVQCPADLVSMSPCNAQLCPVDCVVGSWSEWTLCSKQCDSGLSTRHRQIITPTVAGGKACPGLVETMHCNMQPCPVDCVVSLWDDWEPCSKPCGTGEHKRSRSVVQPAVNGGKPCPELLEYGTCNSQACPVDCIVEEWNSWSPCDKTCGGGTRTRMRSATPPSAGGSPCPALQEVEVCAVQPCPVDCVVSDWAPWEPCSLECGGGEQTRHRAVLIAARHGGKVCPDLIDRRACNVDPCPVMSCIASAWSEWSDCTAACAGGTHFRTRKILVPASSGEACPAVKETRSCNEQPCRIDCVMGAWSAWDSCTKECGNGTQQRSRAVEVQTQAGGLACPTNLIETRICNTQSCRQDCVLSPWSEWSDCSVKCGGGLQTRSRTIIALSVGTASPCPPQEELTEALHCNTHACAVDCIVGNWSEWSNCSRSCGTGERVRTRPVTTAPAFGGAACPATIEYISCNEIPCPIDCILDTWGEWSACSVNCGNGTRTRIRRVKVAAASGGQSCSGPLEQTESCTLAPCPVDCQVGPWSSWTTCSAPCDSGSQIRSRLIASPAQHGGTACPVLFELQPCNTQPCAPTTCLVSEWGEWGNCNATCAGGEQKRFRTIIKSASDCPLLEESRACNLQPCPINCVAGDWSTWASCSKVCGGGTQFRTREIVTQAAYGGIDCASHELSQQRDCNQQACPVDCSVSEWGEWSACSVTCGTGIQQRARSVVQVPAQGGTSCPTLLETRHCTTTCAVDCVVEDWQPWSVCTKPCGTGNRTRIRYVSSAPSNGGAPCPALLESEECNSFPCSADCVVSDWSAWSTCSVPCGTGQQSRTRTVLSAAQDGGNACPALLEVTACEAGPCAQTGCVVSAWSEWTNCTQACAGGTVQRTRTIVSNPQGEVCPFVSESRVCNEQPCPVNCVLSAWTVWSACSRDCGSGTRRRVRTVSVMPAHGGSPCEGTTEEEERCNEQTCSLDCVVSDWTEWSACSASCDAGTSFRSRKVLQAPVGNGSACPTPLFESIVCNAEPCPCIVSSWSVWSPCTKTCDGGTRSRTRTILRASSRGAACPELEQYEECNTQVCTGNENDETGHYQPQPEDDATGGGTNTGTDPTDVVVVIDGCKCGNPEAVNCLGTCDSTTCSGRGQCALSGLCACTNGFRGLTCGTCADGVDNYPNCDRCVPGRYSYPLCIVECGNSSTCKGNGVCNPKGTCDCKPGFAGPNCDRCATGYYFSDGACVYCNASISCSGNGRCLSDGTCQCQPGFAGNTCNVCEDSSPDVFPACKPFGYDRTSSSKGAAGECSSYGGTVALAVILSILGTALLAAALIAGYLFMKRKQQKAKPAAFDEMDSTLLNEYKSMHSSTAKSAAIDDDRL